MLSRLLGKTVICYFPNFCHSSWGFQGFCLTDDDKSAGDLAMEKLIGSISELAAKVLDVFGKK